MALAEAATASDLHFAVPPHVSRPHLGGDLLSFTHFLGTRLPTTAPPLASWIVISQALSASLWAAPYDRCYPPNAPHASVRLIPTDIPAAHPQLPHSSLLQSDYSEGIPLLKTFDLTHKNYTRPLREAYGTQTPSLGSRGWGRNIIKRVPSGRGLIAWARLLAVHLSNNPVKAVYAGRKRR
jgi:hypothetical protein